MNAVQVCIECDATGRLPAEVHTVNSERYTHKFRAIVELVTS